jgi:hypothetical protein
MANMAAGTTKGRALGSGTGAPVDLTAAQLRANAGIDTADTLTIAGVTLSASTFLNLFYLVGGPSFEGFYLRSNSAMLRIGTGDDVAISRISDDLMGVGKGSAGSFSGSLKLTNLQAVAAITLGESTVATLPTASTNARKRYEVTDASAPSVGATVSGGGSDKCTVRSNGANWIVIELL